MAGATQEQIEAARRGDAEAFSEHPPTRLFLGLAEKITRHAYKVTDEDLDALREAIRDLVLRHGKVVIETLSWGVLDAQAERAKLGDKLSPAERPVPAPPRRSEGRSRARRPALRRRSLTTPRRPSRAPRRKAAGK